MLSTQLLLLTVLGRLQGPENKRVRPTGLLRWHYACLPEWGGGISPLLFNPHCKWKERKSALWSLRWPQWLRLLPTWVFQCKSWVRLIFLEGWSTQRTSGCQAYIWQECMKVVKNRERCACRKHFLTSPLRENRCLVTCLYSTNGNICYHKACILLIS